MGGLIVLAIALAAIGCGPAATGAERGIGARDRVPGAVWVLVRPPGSRVELRAPAELERVAHTLVYRDPARDLSVSIADATVAEGREGRLLDAWIARHAPALRAPPAVRAVRVGELDARECTLELETGRQRIVSIGRGGRVARVAVAFGDPALAPLADRILRSIRFDERAALDPAASLGVTAPSIEGMPLLAVTNERLTYRASGEPTPFGAAASLDVLRVPFVGGAAPRDVRARGALVGAQFAGVALEREPELTASAAGALELEVDGSLDGRPLALYGAYLEDPAGAWIVRASAPREDADLWIERFRAAVRALAPAR